MNDFLAAAVQLTSSQDPEANFTAAEEQIDLAARRGAELVGKRRWICAACNSLIAFFSLYPWLRCNATLA